MKRKINELVRGILDSSFQFALVAITLSLNMVRVRSGRPKRPVGQAVFRALSSKAERTLERLWPIPILGLSMELDDTFS